MGQKSRVQLFGDPYSIEAVLGGRLVFRSPAILVEVRAWS